ncbi:MAG: polyribonucleotide nucleotidyltransferase [Eubacterium coprostanoligenes]|uniref:polyribonucleotide nucleotidyltransferase n=1 Tax=Eubacterium coprostanoligenes TaxID=290054 RepID=UPI0024091C98|nr:polyribonucleotide nucleotidyltransferase [Eubacterium coprostanoligenes]MDD6665174.1 polyribonucleotide nucleotidyltransferase [Eubacterium coprostanoligenes]
MFFKNFKVWETELAGRKLTLETGKMAGLANASILARYGETEVLCNVTASAKPREGVDFFPLSVDYEEKMYSVGRIPGSFQRREGRASEKAILTSRCIDRPIRPLFPKDLRNDCSVVATVMSVDPDCSPEITAMIGVSAAIAISDIPWDGPISGVNVGLVDGQIVINPGLEDRAKSDLVLTVASTADLIAMIEAGGNEISDEQMFDAIMAGHEENKKIVKFIQGIVDEIGKPKFAYESSDPDPEILAQIEDFCIEDVKKALDTDDKNVRDEALLPIYDAVHEKFDELFEGNEGKIDEIMYLVQKHVVRAWLKDEHKRVDGRGIDEIRPLNAEIDLLSRVHGSGMFTRGQTQVLSVATLGPMNDAQILDGLDEQTEKRYIHHYNFPSYSVGETKPSRGPGRREIGHGALAEKALVPVLPSVDEFPYAIRVVSEVLSSNGSTSQGSICGSTLALMAAGVPIKAPVAGISCGLITGDEGVYGDFMTMVDIQGLEDFYGDMDFKVAGTKKGITAIQMDLKVHGLTPEIIKEAFAKTHKARNYILDEIMLPVISEPRKELSKYAPKMYTLQIDPDKIGDVIGKGGKVIQEIQAEYEVKINIEEDGRVFISGVDAEKCEGAVGVVKLIATDPEVGAFYNGVVTRIMNFGAFVEIAPGKEGLVHISRLDVKRTEKVEDVVNVGDSIIVKCIEIDDQGRINLSRRDALIELEGMTPENDIEEAPRKSRRDNRRGDRR